MSPQLSRRVGRALSEHWCSFDERDQVLTAAEAVDRWADLPAAIQKLVSDIESRPLVLSGTPPDGSG